MAARFWVGGTGTWDGVDTTFLAATSGGAGGQSVPGSSDTVTFDASSGGGTVTVNTTVNVTSITMGAFTGTLDFATNNNNVTLSSFAGSGTGTRTLNMGDGTWTITLATGNAWDISTGTNFTLNANSSTLIFAATQSGNRTFAFNNKTYNNVAITNATSAAFLNDFASSTAFAIAGTFALTNVRAIRMPAGTIVTITGAWTWDGSSSAQHLLFTNGGTGTVTVGAANTLSWIAAQNIIKAGAGSITINNGFDAGGNSDVTINKPAGGARIIGG